MARVKYDWEAIERQYRTGQFSNVGLAKIFNCSEGAIRKRAKAEGWTRDLVPDFHKELENEIVREPKQESTKNELKSDLDRTKDKDTIRLAVERSIEIIRQHRKHVASISELADKIEAKLKQALKDDKGDAIKWLTHSKESVIDMIWKLSRVRSECVKLERQAFNLDAKEKESDESSRVEERIKENMKKNGFN